MFQLPLPPHFHSFAPCLIKTVLCKWGNLAGSSAGWLCLGEWECLTLCLALAILRGQGALKCRPESLPKRYIWEESSSALPMHEYPAGTFSPRQLKSMSFVSRPALALANLPTQAGWEHNHRAAAFLAEKVLSLHVRHVFNEAGWDMNKGHPSYFRQTLTESDSLERRVYVVRFW